MTSHPPTILQPLEFALRGSQLIEASAGTGKTYTIAALYLRLVLGHGGAAAFHRPLTPPEILVVTFTEAATKELRDRIRARLAEAATAFLQEPGGDGPGDTRDALLLALRAQYPQAEWPAHARTLRLAAEWMDEASVSTIHSWCLRMLQEHAFDSGSLFTQQLQTDQRELYAEVVRDYWRTFFNALSEQDARAVSTLWPTPDALLSEVKNLLAMVETLGPGCEPAQALQQAREQAARTLAELKAPWRGDGGWVPELAARLDAAVAAKHIKMPARKAWMAAIRTWAEGDAVSPKLTDKALTRLSPEDLARSGASDAALLGHPALRALAALPSRIRSLPNGRTQILPHAAAWARQRLASEQMRLSQMGFNELLTRLDAALQGPSGTQLAQRIRAQFPVAMIDEFQDTDPIQYRIFDAIYKVAANHQDTALVLIGDPKQAIYAFRGADIFTYLTARRHTGERHATLGTNFRSTTDMVAAVNALFQRRERHDGGRGAFLFRSRSDNPIPFFEVQAQGRRQQWQMAGEVAPALTFWTLPQAEPAAVGQAQQVMSAECATEIVRLLNAGQQGQAGFVGEDAVLAPVKPGDIAVLVNSGREAALVRKALAERGVRSVYLSDKESVFQSVVAGDLQYWLAACAQPDNDRRLRAALATATLALDWAALDELNHDELKWEARVLQFREYRQLWRRQGVLPMLRRLLNDFAVPLRLVTQGEERQLTDLLHLAELLQRASAQLEGEHGLIRYLAEQRQDDGTDSDARKLRLESDADLVKVVTVHKSKGLEYPLVFLPFATAFRATDTKDLPLKWHDDQGRLQVALAADERAIERVDHERLGEDLRKLYVALTRARFATWVGAAPLKEVERSALGYLLGGGAPLGPATLIEALDDLAGTSRGVAVREVPEALPQRYLPAATTRELAPEPALATGVRVPWWNASYSALRVEEAARETGQPFPVGPTSGAENSFLDSREDTAGGEVAASAGTGMHGFPKGPRPGTFLHDLLEWAARQGFAQALADPDEMRRQIALRCQRESWGEWEATLQTWLTDWLRTPIHLHGLVPGITPFAPAELKQVQPEMEFWFAANTVDTAALDRLVRQYTLDGEPRPALSSLQINGMFKGYIDLLFEHEGRYFVADYKSNKLGPGDPAYTPQAMRQAILDNRYELQYVLYIFALHRLLRSRLPDYDYERHVGGAVYLFLRGHAAPSQGLHGERPPKALMDELDRLFSGQPQQPAGVAA